MKKNIFFLLFLFLLLNTVASAKEITNEDIYRELKVFQARTEERFIAIDKRFEQIDKRFEQIDKRFEDTFNFLWILTGIFTALTVGILGFSYWDRRTIIKKAKEEAIETIETSGSYFKLLSAFRELAKSDKKVANVLCACLICYKKIIPVLKFNCFPVRYL